MTLQQKAEEFLSYKRIAVVGVSREAGTGNGIFKRMRETGYDVFPVNPNATEVEGVPCFASVKDIPGGVDGAVIVTKPAVTEMIVRECADAGVPRVWMHYNAMFGAGNSSASDSAVAFCNEHDIEVIPGGCPLMYGPTADFGHKCMRWILGATGKLPEAA